MNKKVLDTPTLATQFYGLVDSGQPRQLLDYLIDHPETKMNAEALQEALQFPQHKDVALAAYSIGETAAALGLKQTFNLGVVHARGDEVQAAVEQAATLEAGYRPPRHPVALSVIVALLSAWIIFLAWMAM